MLAAYKASIAQVCSHVKKNSDRCPKGTSLIVQVLYRQADQALVGDSRIHQILILGMAIHTFTHALQLSSHSRLLGHGKGVGTKPQPISHVQKLKTPFLGKEVRRSRTSFPKNGVFNFWEHS